MACNHHLVHPIAKLEWEFSLIYLQKLIFAGTWLQNQCNISKEPITNVDNENEILGYLLFLEKNNKIVREKAEENKLLLYSIAFEICQAKKLNIIHAMCCLLTLYLIFPMYLESETEFLSIDEFVEMDAELYSMVGRFAEQWNAKIGAFPPQFEGIF